MVKRTTKRLGGRRPLNPAGKRQMIAVRLDPEVLEALKHEADSRNMGYHTVINNVLASYVRRRAASQ